MRDRKKYMKEWRSKNRDKIRGYEQKYRENHLEKIKEKEARRRKRPERIKYMNNYSKQYVKLGEAKLKHQMRARTNKKYGKTPKGYEKHHLDYETPDNFILVSIKEHKLIHKNTP